MFKIATTETYDPSLCVKEWIDQVKNYDFVLYITKHITSEVAKLFTEEDSPLYYGKMPSIIHATCTGWGGDVLEYNVPNPEQTIENLFSLISRGYPKERIVLRIDPIIPTQRGIDKFLYAVEIAYDLGITRVRSSMMQMYQHVADRMEAESNHSEIIEILNAYRNLYYNETDSSSKKYSFFPTKEYCNEHKIYEKLESVVNMFKKLSDDKMSFESCASPVLQNAGFVNVGCMSNWDLAINNITGEMIPKGNQRQTCSCLLKHQLIPGGYKRGRCPHKCLFCYLKDVETKEQVSTGDALY